MYLCSYVEECDFLVNGVLLWGIIKYYYIEELVINNEDNGMFLMSFLFKDNIIELRLYFEVIKGMWMIIYVEEDVEILCLKFCYYDWWLIWIYLLVEM